MPTTMDFFGRQDQARRKTGLLVFLFILAVFSIIAATYLVTAGVLVYWQKDLPFELAEGQSRLAAMWNPILLATVGGATLLVVGGGSLYKLNQLRGGGGVIAEQLGGQPIQRGGETTPAEKKVLNVVDEMAIASGIAAPPVYLMGEERSINAFAAGDTPGNAVIGVTRGTIERLDRDELQGVIAHEFSHILNGDMRTNLRLMGVLHGILIIGLLGFFILRLAFYSSVSSHHSYSSSRSDRKGGGLPLLVLGFGLAAVGFIGTFFGNLIKAAVSRQREFLADASAVQFTRNPGGISGALKKIGGFSAHSEISNGNAPEASHMFFGQAVTKGINGMLATHPPLVERIRAIEPSWAGEFPDLAEAEAETQAATMGVGAGAAGMAGASGFAGGGTSGGMAGGASDGGTTGEATGAGSAPGAGAPAGESTRGAIDRVGQPTEAHLRHAAELRRRIPETLTDAAHEPYGARAVVYALVIDQDAQSRKAQFDRLNQHGDEGIAALTRQLLPAADSLNAELRLPLLDMAIPTLRTLSPSQYEAFEQNLQSLIEADEKIELFEWCLSRIVLHHLQPEFGKARRPRMKYKRMTPLQEHCRSLLSTLAYAGHRDAEAARSAFDAGAAELPLPRMDIMPAKEAGLQPLADALDALEQSSMRCKRDIIRAAAACIEADHQITPREAELFRAIGETLDSPVPPLLPGQKLM